MELLYFWGEKISALQIVPFKRNKVHDNTIRKFDFDVDRRKKFCKILRVVSEKFFAGKFFEPKIRFGISRSTDSVKIRGRQKCFIIEFPTNCFIIDTTEFARRKKISIASRMF